MHSSPITDDIAVSKRLKFVRNSCPLATSRYALAPKKQDLVISLQSCLTTNFLFIGLEVHINEREKFADFFTAGVFITWIVDIVLWFSLLVIPVHLIAI